MKVLFISNYKDGHSGWAHAAQNYILAMDAANINVIPRAVRLNNIPCEVPRRILELEQQSDKNCDIVIQKVLPNQMSYSGKFKKNIGLFVTETNSFRSSSWPNYANTMDEIWVPSTFCKKACKNSGIYKPVYAIPEPVNPAKFRRGYEPLNIPEAKYKFCFYFIGENIVRKNLIGLLQAFHSEFRQSEPVHLIIKTHGRAEQIQHIIQSVKQSLKLHRSLNSFIQETLIVDDFSEEEICRLHCTGNCLVAPSFGEGWGIPAQEAMLFGNTPIYTENLGMDDHCGSTFTKQSGGLPILSYETLVSGTLDTFSDLCTANETWYAPDILDLRRRMRQAYQDDDEIAGIRKYGLQQLSRFSYKAIGKIIKERLENE